MMLFLPLVGLWSAIAGTQAVAQEAPAVIDKLPTLPALPDPNPGLKALGVGLAVAGVAVAISRARR